MSLVFAEDVIEPVEHGHINWTHSRLVIEAGGGQNTGAWTDTKLVEQTAVSQLEMRVRQAALDLPYDEDRQGSDLLEEDDLSRALDEGLASWTIAETRYYSSGKVELRAEVDLQDWLRPALTQQAEADPDQPKQPTAITGVVLDARGLDVSPALTISVLAPGKQDVLYSVASLTKDTAATTVPVIWVTDPSDTAAIERAGAQPAFLDVEAVRGDNGLILTNEDASRLRSLGVNTDLLRTARVVVVVDAP